MESAWWSPLQLEHLNIWGQDLPLLVSSLSGLILSLALQHQPNSLWCSDLWGPLHLTHLAPWILHDMMAWPHFQQFLQSRTPGFIFAPLMVAIKFPMLKHLLINIFAFLPLWTSQMSIHTKAMSDFGETLITLGFEAREMLSNSNPNPRSKKKRNRNRNRKRKLNKKTRVQALYVWHYGECCLEHHGINKKCRVWSSDW